MYSFIVAVIAIAGWVLGQVLVLMNHVSSGAAIMVFSLLFGFIFIFKVWEHLGSPGNLKLMGMNAPVILATAALVAACAGSLVVMTSPREALLLYILAGIMLFMAKPVNEKFFDFFEIPEKSEPMQKWEPWFFVILTIFSFAIRLYRLADIPPVAHGGEGLLIGNCSALAAKGAGYMPHIGGGSDWPTLTYYMGIFFAQVFGWDIGSFRISSAVLGGLSIPAYYFLARRITSPGPAAVTALMYSVFISSLTMSRQFIPPLTLLFLPHVICLGILLAAARKPSWLLYLAAGCAAGFSLQGYVPGRGVFLLLSAWFMLMIITRKNLFHNYKNFIIFWAGFIVVASPVIYYAIRYPDMYWGYVRSVDPNRASGLKAYLQMAYNSIPAFADMFYRKSAWDVLFHLPYKPLFDIVMKVAFSSGLFLCLLAFWKPVPSILLILFFGGMVPGLLGGGSSIPPNTQRTLLTFPVIFIFCAYAFERIKRVYYGSGYKILHGLFLAAGLAAGLWSFYNGFAEYFFRFANDPSVKINAGYHLYEMGRELKKYPKAEAYVTPFFVGNDTFGAFAPPGRRISAMKHLDDMLVLKPGSDSLLMFEPFYTNVMGYLKTIFPNALITTYRETKEGEKDYYYTSMQLHPGGRRHIDEYYPFVFFNSVMIPRQDVADFQTMLFGPSADSAERVRVFGNSGFTEKHSGKRVSLKGAFLVPEFGHLDTNISDALVVSIGWKSWRLIVDGTEKQFDRPLNVDSGIHFFELSGTVPAGASGDLPLVVMQGKRNYLSEARIVAAKGPVGIRTFHYPGFKSWDSKSAYSRRLIAANFRMYDGLFMSLPFSIRQEAFIKVPQTGEYEFKANENSCFRIKVGGKNVVDNLADQSVIKSEKVYISKDKPEKFEVLMSVLNSPIYTRALTVYVKGPGMNGFEMAPVEWFSPVD